MRIDFVTIIGQGIQTKKISIVLILLLGRNIIELYNVSLAPKCDFNLISLSHLCESGIIYYNNLIIITLIRNGKIIVKAKREQNLFTFNLADSKKAIVVINPPNNIKHRAMVMIRQGRLIYLVSQSKHLQLWRQRLAHISNIQTLRAIKPVDRIKLVDNKKYNPAKILIKYNDINIFDNKETRIQVKVRAITTTLQIIKTDFLDKIYVSCSESKSM